MRYSERQRAEMAAAVAKMEAEGHKVFRPSEFKLAFETLEESTHATILGMACEYRVIALADGNCIGIWNGFGMWPYASILLLVDEGTRHPYPKMLRVIADEIDAEVLGKGDDDAP